MTAITEAFCDLYQMPAAMCDHCRDTGEPDTTSTTPERRTPTGSTVSLDDMLALGISYRQLNYWTVNGHLKPEIRNPDRGRGAGSGHPFVWPMREYQVARVLVRLRTAGVALSTAARLARWAVETGQSEIPLGGGFTLRWETPA